MLGLLSRSVRTAVSMLPSPLYGGLRRVCGPTTFDSLMQFRRLPAGSTPEADARNRTCIFIEPHFDDVAFSCGGFLTKLARRRRAQTEETDLHLLTVFARGPDDDVPSSAVAQNVHREWGLDPPSFRSRRQEARSATASLPLTAHELGFRDVLYRRRRTLDALDDVRQPEASGADAPCFLDVARALRDTVNDLRGASGTSSSAPKALIVAPLGVGGHIDHRVVHAAVRHYASHKSPPTLDSSSPNRSPVEVWYYEDFPYVRFASVSDRIRDVAGTPRPATVDVSTALDARIEISMRYASQVQMLFDTPQDLKSAIQHHARREVGTPSRPKERFWKWSGVSPPVETA